MGDNYRQKRVILAETEEVKPAWLSNAQPMDAISQTKIGRKARLISVRNAILSF
jgi:hypothetical protein